MELFGNHILDFPEESASLFLGRLPPVSESVSDLLDIQEDWGVIHGEESEETGENEENDSIFSEANFQSNEVTKAGLEPFLLNEEDFQFDNSSFEDLRSEGRPGFECDVLAVPQPHTDRDAQHIQHAKSRARLGGEPHKSVPCREAGSPLTCPSSPSDQGYSSPDRPGEQQIDHFPGIDIKEKQEEVEKYFLEEFNKSSSSLDPTNTAPLPESLNLSEKMDCDLGRKDFNLGVAQLFETVMYDGSTDKLETATADSTEYGDMLDSILSSLDNSLDPANFTILNELKKDTSQIVHQEQQEEEKNDKEEQRIHSSSLDHDYCQPTSLKSPSRSATSTPNSPENDFDTESQLSYKVKYAKSLLRHPDSGTQKLVRSHGSVRDPHTTTEDLKFGGGDNNNYDMLLKSRMDRWGDGVEQEWRRSIPSSGSNRQKTEKENIEAKREQVKNTKRKLKQEGKEAREEHKAKHSRYTDLQSKPDITKYRKFEEERELHNALERQRRKEQKEAYDSLKERIPTIANEDKVSKLMILNTACHYSQGLGTLETRLKREKQALLDRIEAQLDRRPAGGDKHAADTCDVNTARTDT